MDFPEDAGLVCEFGLNSAKSAWACSPGLVSKRRSNPGRRVRPDRAETVRHRRVAAFVAELPDLPEQTASGQIRAVPDLVREISLVRLQEPRPRLPRRIGRSREAPSRSLRTVLRSKPVRRAIALIERPSRFSSCNMTIFSSFITRPEPPSAKKSDGILDCFRSGGHAPRNEFAAP